MEDRIANRARFDLIRYANCWEDADILCEALQPAPGKRMLSIASAGDNALALLAEGAEVVAADLSPAQLACTELRRAGFRHLSRDELLGFLGVRPMSRRAAVYEALRADLSPAAQAFWAQHGAAIEAGCIHAGKFESYFRLFRTRVLPWIHSRRTRAELLAPKSAEAQRRFYRTRWNNLRWRGCFKLFFGRAVMGRFGRDPEFFRYVEGRVSDRILDRARHGLSEIPTHSNPYLTYIFTGTFSEQALPRYLRAEHFAAIRDGLDRLHLHGGPIDEAADRYADGGWDGYNLSDIFEYVDEAAAAALYGRLLTHANAGARLAYWNMLAPRRRPPAQASRVRSLDAPAAALFQADKAFFYSAFIVDEVQA
jgi:S-adenosylmethionine-diacylglycerol 3-amino-3-carboxypropyl transferase